MELQQLIERTLTAANHAEWMGMLNTRNLLISLVDQLEIHKKLQPKQSFPMSGDNFRNVVDLSEPEKFTIH